MENEIVSVIIPVYNVFEKYFKLCIDSILKQTYSQIEIVIVDDGSNEETRKLCDRIKNMDKRIKVFHKKNEGVSSARNFGINNCTGRYVIFVDADDFLHNDMIEILYKNAKSINADISMCGFLVRYPNGKIVKCNNTKKTTIFTKEECIKAFLEDDTFGIAVWNKLFNKKSIEKIYFNEKYSVNEDKLFLLQVILKSNYIIYEDLCKYEYIKRDNSVTSQVSMKKLDVIQVHNDIEKLLKNYPQFNKLIKVNKVTYLIQLYNIYILSKDFKKYIDVLDDIRKKINKEAIKIRELNNIRKIQMEYIFIKYFNILYRPLLKISSKF